MKGSKFATLITGLMIAIFGFSGLVLAAEPKFAFVDVAKVFDNYQKTKDNDKSLQEKGRSKEEERDALVHEVRQLKDELALLGEDARAKKQDDLEGKIRTLQDFDQKTKQDLGNQRRTVVQEIFKDIDDTVQRYGERKGLDLVFNERALLFHSTAYDATEDVLKELNKDYLAKKKK